MTIPRNLSFLAQGASASGVLSVPYGGTGVTTLTANYIPYGNGTGAFNSSANLTFNGSNLLVNTTYNSGAGISVGNGLTVVDPSISYLISISAAAGLSTISTYGTTQAIGFNTNTGGGSSTEKMRIFGSGGVSIGNTTDPGATNLSVTGTGTFGTTVSVGAATPSASGAGITFPATQSASTDVNTLDDYEEGTWSPTIGGATTQGTIVLSFQYGKYTKIGNQVTATFTIIVASVTVAAAGPINIFGLPFTSTNSNSLYRAGGGIANMQGLQLNGTAPLLEVANNSTTMTVYGFNNNAAFGASDATSIGAGDFINGSIVYQTT